MRVSNDRNAFPFKSYGSFTLPYKGEAAIFVEYEYQVAEAIAILTELDAYEMSGYYPQNLVKWYDTSKEYYPLEYIGKFDTIDMGKFLDICWERGIRCFIETAEKHFDD